MATQVVKPNHIFFSGGPAMPDPTQPLFAVAAAYSQTLYGPDALAIVDANAREVFGLYNDNLPFQVRYACVVKNRADSQKVVDMTRDPNCIGLFPWAHTFHPMENSMEALKGLRVPLIHVAGSYHETIPDATDMTHMNLYQGAHAKREFSNGLRKLGIPQYPVIGHMKSQDFLKRLEMYGRVAAAVAELKGKMIYRCGGKMPDVVGTDISLAELQAMGVGIDEAIPHAWYKVMQDPKITTDEKVNAEIADWEKRYDLASDLKEGGAHRKDLILAAKQTVALRHILSEKEEGRPKYAGWTSYFGNVGELEQLQAQPANESMYSGWGFGAEGHAGAAVMNAAQIIMSQGLPGGSSFTEPYLDDAIRHALLYSHMAEGNPRIALGRPTLEYTDLGIGPDKGPVRGVFKYDLGECVLASLVNHPNHIEIVTTLGEVIETPPLPNLRNSNGLVRLVNGYEAEIRSLELGEHHHPELWLSRSKDVTKQYMAECMETLAKMWGIGHTLI